MRLLENEQFSSNLDSIIELMEMLKVNHGVKFSFQISENDRHSLRMVSDNMDDHSYNRHIEGYLEEMTERRRVQEMIACGRVIVECMSDEEKPEDFTGDWPVKGRRYAVSGYIRLENGNYCLELEGMQTNEPYSGYASKRFVTISSSIQNN